MDNNLTDYVQDSASGNDAGKAIEDCLRNPVIIKKILQHFSSAELLKLSLVNKLWTCEAQSVMRKRDDFTAHVKSHQVVPFISDLRQMNPVPFSGISINIYYKPCLAASSFEERVALQGVILDQPTLKTVSLQLRGSWLNNMNSLGFLLSKKVLQDCSGVLEELELQVDNGRGEFMENVVQDVSFSRLRILKLRENRRKLRYGSISDEDYAHYVKMLLSRAPNLKMLHSNWSIKLLLSVLQGSSVVPVYTSQVVSPFVEMSENIISSIKLASIELRYTGREFNFERFNIITPMLLRTSCTTTLRHMDIDAVLMVPLMCYGVCLENVKYIRIDINYDRLEQVEPRILEIIKNFNFIGIFPKLNQVQILDYYQRTPVAPNQMQRIIEQANAVLMEPMPDRAANIKVLDLLQMHLSSEAAQFFAQMFPNIQTLKICIIADETAPFKYIWKTWVNLNELSVSVTALPYARNLDSVFCGIFPQEVAELRKKDEDYLKRVNIVPVMPAVTCLKNLRVLSLDLEHYDHPDFFRDDATFFLSKVTALLVFARRPALAVSLKEPFVSILPPMDHLKPYVSISTGSPRGRI